MIVVDASAALLALLDDGPARRSLSREQLHAPHLIDPEVANSLRRRVAAGEVSLGAGHTALRVWSQLGITRYAVLPLLGRVWALRENLSAYDASYVALAEVLGCDLVTADARLSRAPGLNCPVTVVPQ